MMTSSNCNREKSRASLRRVSVWRVNREYREASSSRLGAAPREHSSSGCDGTPTTTSLTAKQSHCGASRIAKTSVSLQANFGACHFELTMCQISDIQRVSAEGAAPAAALSPLQCAIIFRAALLIYYYCSP